MLIIVDQSTQKINNIHLPTCLNEYNLIYDFSNVYVNTNVEIHIPFYHINVEKYSLRSSDLKTTESKSGHYIVNFNKKECKSIFDSDQNYSYIEKLDELWKRQYSNAMLFSMYERKFWQINKHDDDHEAVSFFIHDSSTTFKFTNKEGEEKLIRIPFQCNNIVYLTELKKQESKYRFVYCRFNHRENGKTCINYELLTIVFDAENNNAKDDGKREENIKKKKYSIKTLKIFCDPYMRYTKIFEVYPQLLMLRKDNKIFQIEVGDDTNGDDTLVTEFSCPRPEFLKNSEYGDQDVDDRSFREYDIILLPTPPGEIEFVKNMILENTNLISQVVEIITTLIYESF
jgi:hypothetical protein